MDARVRQRDKNMAEAGAEWIDRGRTEAETDMGVQLRDITGAERQSQDCSREKKEANTGKWRQKWRQAVGEGE